MLRCIIRIVGNVIEVKNMDNCKHCNSNSIVKNGIVRGAQRYLCKLCNRTSREGDKRLKYSDAVRIRVMKWYLEGVGIRSIERRENISTPLIIQWIRKFGTFLKEQLLKARPPEDIKDIQILELDELYSYCKKKRQRIYI